MSTIYQIVITALIVAFVILFLGKTGLRLKIRDYCDKKRLRLIADMIDCDFCLSFWLCVIILICSFLFGHSVSLLVLVCSPPITRFLV